MLINDRRQKFVKLSSFNQRSASKTKEMIQRNQLLPLNIAKSTRISDSSSQTKHLDKSQ